MCSPGSSCQERTSITRTECETIIALRILSCGSLLSLRGQRVEDLVAWAKEIIASYGDLDLDYLCRRYEGMSLADFKRQLNS